MKKTLCVSTLLCLAGQPLVAQERPNVIAVSYTHLTLPTNSRV